MSLALYYHPLASFCWKALIALYEHATPFEPRLVDLMDPRARADFAAIWPLAKFPVLRDGARRRTIPESTSIIEYLALHYPGPSELVPRDPEAAFEARHWDRFYDDYVHEPMQKIVLDKLRPAGQNDPHGVAQARATLATAYGIAEAALQARTWAAGETFGLADCAAAPALYYADRVQPLAGHPRTAAYLQRLRERPSFARVFEEAQPYFHAFPG